MSRKKTKMCLVCGKDFLGNEAAFTCGTACRTFMSRLFAKGKKPEYYFMAKGKGQKVPEIKKEEPKKVTPENIDKKEVKKVEEKEPELTEFQKYQRAKLGLKS